MTTANRIKLLHASAVAPPDTTPELRLPLTFFDVVWIYFHPIQRLLFFHHPVSTPEFLLTVVPRLKTSLSKTLSRYLPLAGTLILPLENTDLPDIHYAPGNTVSVTFAEADEPLDFDTLTAHHPRDADEFHSLVPDFPAGSTAVLAVQVTLFPGAGISIGLINYHAVGEASSIVGFIKSWSLEAKLGRDGRGAESRDTTTCTDKNQSPRTSSAKGCGRPVEHQVESHVDGRVVESWDTATCQEKNQTTRSCPGHDCGCPDQHQAPIFDRSLIADPSRRRANIFWNQMKVINITVPQINLPTNKLRSTFILQNLQIQFLKTLASSQNPNLPHISSFTVAVAYSWVNWVKSAARSGEHVADSEPEYFGFAVDARSRLHPPLPPTYFGNCLAFSVIESTHGILKSEDGFSEAVRLLGEKIKNAVNNGDELMKDADDWPVKFGTLVGKRTFGVAGSPRFDLYEVDFGWGGGKKVEVVSIDGDHGISLSRSPEFEGGLEIGLSARKEKMYAFTELFQVGLSNA